MIDQLAWPSMNLDPDGRLHAYADLAVKVGLNLRRGQRLFIIGPIANGGVSLEAAPLVRQIARSAYAAGSPLVEAIWGDEVLQLTRFAHAPRDSFGEFSAWLPSALADHVASGGAVLSIHANDPDLLSHEPAALVGALQQTVSHAVRPFREQISRNETNWAVITAPSVGWAARVYPDAPPEAGIAKLWDVIERLCRLDEPDPIAAWERHLDRLAALTDHLNAKQYNALKYTGPGTELTIGLPHGHIWTSGRSVSRSGIAFTANLPTEEIFTIPHKDRADGVVTSSKPLSYGGQMIDRFRVEFHEGRVTGLKAERGEAALRRLIDTDPGAARLGEVALVPHSSPVSQCGILFYNTLLDENAASHVALGNAYKFTLSGGDAMSDEEFERAGGNRSATHVDFMIGSGDLDVDGILDGALAEPLMRRGEWVGTEGSWAVGPRP